MFDGAAAVVAEPLVFEGSEVDAGASEAPQSGSGQLADDSFLAQQIALATSDPAGQEISGAQIVIYDASIEGIDDVISSLSAEYRAYALPEDGDAISAITDILREAGSVEALHVLTHGSEGKVWFGESYIDQDGLQAQAEQLSEWAQYLTADADILLYGCDIAADDAGQVFLDNLSSLTGADVAASDDATGATLKAGDWDLEASTGLIEATALNGEGLFDGTLAATVINDASSNWITVLKSASFDPGQDLQAQSTIDLVGDADEALLFMKFDDKGTTSTADDEIAFRIRTDQSIKADDFAGIVWMGIDVDKDNDLDVFLMATGVSSAQGAGTFSLEVYDAGNTTQISPSTTSLGSTPTSLISGVESHFDKVITIDTANPSGGDADADTNADYFISFKINADTLFSAINLKQLTGEGTQISGVNKDTALQFVVATASQTNSLNGDFGGYIAGESDITFKDKGVFIVTSLGDPGSAVVTATGPTVTVANLSFTEGNGATVIDTSATGNDVDGDTDWDTNAKMEVQITANNQSTDVLAISTAGNFSISGANLSHSGTIIGTIAEASGTTNDGTVTNGDKLTINFNSSATNAIVQSLVQSITFNNTSDAPSTTARTVTFSLTDKGGLTGTDTSIISVAAVNDLPTSSDKTVTTAEDTAKVFIASDFNFADVDGDTLASVKITQLETKGALQYNNGTAFVDVTLNQVITKADIDAGKLRFVPAANENGTGYDTFKFQVNDGTAFATAASTMTVNVTPVNDLPTASDKTVTTAEDTAKVLVATDFNYLDADSDALASVKITQLEAKGTLQYNNGTAFVDVTLNQVITKADIDAGKLRFVPAANENGTGYDTFKFQVNDGTAFSTAASTMTVNVTPVNDLPTTADKTVTTPQNTAKVIKTSDFAFTDVDGDSLASIKITQLEIKGALQFNNGTAFVDVTLNQVITKADIDAGKLRFNPGTDETGNGYATFNFQVNDGTDFSAASSTVTVNVTPVNAAPDITSSGGGSAATVTVVEGTKLAITVVATDSNSDTMTFSLTGGVDQGLFDIDPKTGAVTFKTVPDFEAPVDSGKNNIYEIVVSVSDGNGGTTTQTISINVTDLNEVPDITSNGGGSAATITIEEGNTPVTTVAATDVDGNTVTYSITGGVDQGNFEIDPNTGALKFKTAPDFENPTDSGNNNNYKVQVTVSDGKGGTTIQTLTVIVTDKDEATAPPPPPPPASVIVTASPPPPPPPPPPAPVLGTLAPVDFAVITPPAPVLTLAEAGGANTLIFSGDGPALQTIGNTEISVVTAASSSTTTSTASTGDAEGGTPENGGNGEGEGESTLSQSFVISAKDATGGGAVQLSVEQGLPGWMQVQSQGDGTLTIKGDRPEGDDNVYQVVVKMKQADGSEVNVIVTVAPQIEANEDDAPRDPAAEEDATPGEDAKLQDPENSESLAADDWMQQLLAELSVERDDTMNPDGEPNTKTFTGQLASEAGQRIEWLKAMAGHV